MEKQYLEKLKNKISKLSEEDKKLRDLYLKQISSGELEGPMVGYSSIDKPWLKYYSEEQLNEEALELSCYENMYKNNIEHLDDIAFEYYENKITYKELFENIDKAAKALVHNGVKQGDIVTIMSITTPEIMYLFYAINKIGAVSNMVDVRYTKQATEMYLKEVKSKLLITLDLCYKKVDDIIDKTDVEKVLIVSPTNSVAKTLKPIIKIDNLLKGKKDNIPYGEKYINWNEFIKGGQGLSIDTVPYEKDYPAAIVHTGGTTGVPKGVVLTNDNFNNVALQIKNSNVNAQRGYRFLNIMPPFIAYGIALGLYTPITLGWHTVIIPQFDPKKFDNLLLKHKPNGIMGVPTYWENVMSSKKMKNKDLSFIKNILLGGDKIKGEFELRLDEYLKQHNCTAGVGKGYSMTEASACATFSSPVANKLDSVGAPLTKTVVAAFEPGTTKELTVGQVGEICIKTPTAMKEYYHMENDTKKVRVTHDDGVWIHSGDIGYVDKDGIVFIKDRIKRMIIRSGFKVFPSEIENTFMKHPGVKACAVVGIDDNIDITAPKAHIVLNEEYIGSEDIVLSELRELFINSALPPYFEPVDYKFRESLPLTDIGKIDFISLQDEEKVKVKIKK